VGTGISTALNNSAVSRFALIVGMVLGITSFAVGVCCGLKIVYWNWMKIPIGLGGSLFFLFVIPTVFLLSVPYAVATVGLANKSVSGLKRLVMKSGFIAAIVILIVLAIIFPCEMEPYFVGGYFIGKLVGSF
jgi:hypothetical protein